MHITHGLIIADPWIDHILEGRKDWEMRSQATSVRGWIALIRKGSGTVVGVAQIVDCGRSLSQAEMLDSISHHRIPADMIRRGEVAKWVIPWKLKDITRLPRPLPYDHKSGAVIWVTLSDELGSQLASYVTPPTALDSAAAVTPQRVVNSITPLSTVQNKSEVHAPHREKPARPTSALPSGNHSEIGRSVLSGGNIRNNHIKLAPVLHAMPVDVIGGSNASEAAARTLEIHWGGPEYAVTDIDGTKSIFRKRGWVRRFFAAANAKEGDSVVFERTSPYRLNLRIEREG